MVSTCDICEFVFIKLKKTFVKFKNRIVVLSVAFKTTGFNAFPLCCLGLVTYTMKILWFHFIFTQINKSQNAKFKKKE